VQLIGQADAAAFVAHVEQHALADLGDGFHGSVPSCWPQIAALGAEDIARSGHSHVDADEDGIFLGDHDAVGSEVADAAQAECQVGLFVDDAHSRRGGVNMPQRWGAGSSRWRLMNCSRRMRS